MKKLWSLLVVGTVVGTSACVGMDEQIDDQSQEVKNTSSTVQYAGQGLVEDEFGGWTLNQELCGADNGADVDGPYLLWVFTSTKATSATITILGQTYTMTPSGKGTFKYISSWYDPNAITAPGAVSATYAGATSNAQLVVSHGCRPFNPELPAWCSPGFWANAQSAAWALTGHAPTDLFNSTVYSEFYGATYAADPTLGTVLGTTGGTYKGAGVLGTSPLLGGVALNAFNATGAYLTNAIPGYYFDYTQVSSSEQCPIDHHGNFKE